MIVKNISKKYGDKILFENISFDINVGLVNLVGESGCGKSTFIKIIMGKIKPDNGEILFQNKDVTFSYVGQDSALFYEYSLLDNIRLFHIDYNQEELNKMLLDFRVETFLNKKLYLLSGGERKKCKIIFALLKKTNIYIFDEPFNSLDKDSKNKLIKIIETLKQDKLVILINHEDLNYNFASDVTLDFYQHKVIAKKNNNLSSNLDVYKKKKYNTSMYLFKNYIFNYKLDFFFKIFFVLILFFSFLSACSLYDNKSKTDQDKISLSNDPFKMHELSIINKNQINEKMFLEKENLYYSIMFVSDPTISLYTRFFLYEVDFASDDIIYFKTFSEYFKSSIFQVASKSYNLVNFDKINCDKYNYTKKIALIMDNKIQDNEVYLFCKQGVIDHILLNGLNNVKFNNNDYKILNNFTYFDIDGNQTNNKMTIIDDKTNTYYISTNKENINSINVKIKSLSGIEKIDNVIYNPLQEEELIINLNVYKDFLLHDDSLLIYVNNDTYFKINIQNEFSLNDVIDSNTFLLKEKSKFFFYLSFFLFFIYIIYCGFSFYSKKKYFKYLNDVYFNNGLSTKQYLFDLFWFRILLLIFAIAIFFLLYIFIGLNVGNYLNMINVYKKRYGSYYYYSEQPFNNYYDYLTSPIKFITFNPISFLIFFIFIVLILDFIATKKLEKSNNS